ncbi:uncharacterized protein LOC127802144 [Diospyros lotus]|uniref:uncharacterized protein LOC127802144 n=1 Tax=Diospyros lotus TaxID=55363 RepID=UPI002254A25D|nr:uncharacterized protein LOC127802144 [Diospyros lotus]
MKVHLKAQDLWEGIEVDYEVVDLPDNLIVTQIRIHKERKTRKAKAMAYLEFEMQRIKESETVKEYIDMLLSLANKVRLLGKDFPDQRIIEKILVTLLERYEVTISSLENTKDLSSISLVELINALQAQEPRRLIRKEGAVEGALQWKKTNHPQHKCWWRPDIKCNKCGQLGHIKIVCISQQQEGEARAAADQHEEEIEELFTAATTNLKCCSSKSYLIDSDATHHMTNNKRLFRELYKSTISRVTIGNGGQIAVKGEGTVAIQCRKGLKLVRNVLYVPEVAKNLFSVSQLLDNGYKVLFEGKCCIIIDVRGREAFKIMKKDKSFALNPLEEEEPSNKDLSSKFTYTTSAEYQEYFPSTKKGFTWR